jgi:hypothetical protein
MITKNIKYSLYYKFHAKIIAIPSSDNEIGVDVWPKFHIRPMELLEVMNYSSNARSVDLGYKKDEESGLYLKNLAKWDKDELLAQFNLFKDVPPFWFNNEEEYQRWVKTTMQHRYSKSLEGRYIAKQASTDATYVGPNTDAKVPVEHYYVEESFYHLKDWFKTVTRPWPKNTGVTFSKL